MQKHAGVNGLMWDQFYQTVELIRYYGVQSTVNCTERTPLLLI